MSSFDENKYQAAREFAHNYFLKHRTVHSPAFGVVHCTSEGFLHLVYADKHHKKTRDWKNQVKRFHLLAYARRIIEGMGFYQEYQEQYQDVLIKRHKQKMQQRKLVRYWGLIAVIDNRIRVKLILRKVGEGNIHFWSIIPYWKVRFYKDIRMVELSTGDMDAD